MLDDPSERTVFNQRLRAAGYRVVYALDGEDGFDRVREVEPDVVLAHLHSARIDGTILCQLVRQETQGALPVILFGPARAFDGHAQQRAESVGARAFIAVEQLEDRLLDVVHRALTEPAAPPPPARVKDPSGSVPMVRPARHTKPVTEEAPFESSAGDTPVEEVVDDMPTSLTDTPEELQIMLREAAAAPAPETTPTPRTPLPKKADILDEPPLPVSGLGPVRPIGSGATGRGHGDDLIAELPREVTPSASIPGGRASVAPPPGARQRKGLDESQLGKRLVRRVQQVHQLLEAVDYYQLLGVEPTATPMQLRDAYFELSLEFHPDRFFLLRSGDIKAKIYAIFRQVSEAYAVLSDERRRAVYDEQRELRRAPVAAPSPPPRSPEPRAPSLVDARDPRLMSPELRLDGVTANAAARRYVQLAQVALKQEELEQARFLLGLAVGLDPTNASLRRVLEGVARRRAKQLRVRLGELVSQA